MRKVVVGAVALLLAGILAPNAEAAPLTGCCHMANGFAEWPVGVRVMGKRRGVANYMVGGIVRALRHHTS